MIAAVVVRTSAEADFRDRLRLEEQLSAAARQFVGLAPEDVDAEVERTLATLGEGQGFDRAMVLLLDGGRAGGAPRPPVRARWW